MTDKEKKAYVDKHLTKIFPQLQTNAKNVTGAGYSKWGDDLLQLSIVMFLDKELEVQYDACVNNKAEHFITFIMNFQLKRGQTTRFWHTHRKFIGQTRELYNGTYDYEIDPEFPEPFEDEVSMLQKCVDRQIAELNPFDKMLIQERIYHGASFKEIGKKYNINYNSLSLGLKQTLKKIKQTCQHLQ